MLRGCRCIEIDVWNGDALVPTTTVKSPRLGHSPGLSGSSFPTVANSVLETVEDKVDVARTYLGEKTNTTRSRSPSATSQARFDDASRHSSVIGPLDPVDSIDRLDAVRPVKSRPRQHLLRGEPIVTHGWTLTTPCGFREVCHSIKESAFVASDLPIIISLEVHADAEQQEVMVKIMKEVWGELLVQEPLEGCDPKFRLPRLEDMRNRILVKVKRAHTRMSQLQHIASAPLLGVEEECDSSDDEALPLPPVKSNSVPVGSSIPETKDSKVKICSNLSDLAIYTRSERFRRFETQECKKPAHIFSISENRILELWSKHHREMFTHNKTYFLRAFPAGRRIDSSNPDPSLFWRKGVQMVAMNWQYLDEGMMLNEGMFSDEEGWVLKPKGYQSTDKTIETQDQAACGKKLDLFITVFAGQHLPVHPDESVSQKRSGRSLRPTVKAELHVEKDVAILKHGQIPESTYKRKTKAGKTNYPNFGTSGTVLRFESIPSVVEELSFLR